MFGPPENKSFTRKKGLITLQCVVRTAAKRKRKRNAQAWVKDRCLTSFVHAVEIQGRFPFNQLTEEKYFVEIALRNLAKTNHTFLKNNTKDSNKKIVRYCFLVAEITYGYFEFIKR